MADVVTVPVQGSADPFALRKENQDVLFIIIGGKYFENREHISSVLMLRIRKPNSRVQCIHD